MNVEAMLALPSYCDGNETIASRSRRGGWVASLNILPFTWDHFHLAGFFTRLSLG